MKTVVHITIHPPVVEEMLAKISALLHQAGDKVEMVVEPEPFDPTIKLTHEQLMALPMENRITYCQKHGGVFAVAKENGYALSEESADAILEYIRRKDT